MVPGKLFHADIIRLNIGIILIAIVRVVVRAASGNRIEKRWRVITRRD